jgi:hypothetical protein
VENGSKLLYWNEGDMALLGADGTSQSLPWGDGMATPSVSGDEQWVALCRWANGPVYVGPYPDLGSVTVATTVGCTPKWSADATRLYFQDLDSLWVMPARVSSNGIVFGERELVAELGVWSRKAYDVDARGRMLVTYNGFPDARPPVLVVNWQNRER